MKERGVNRKLWDKVEGVKRWEERRREKRRVSAMCLILFSSKLTFDLKVVYFMLSLQSMYLLKVDWRHEWDNS